MCANRMCLDLIPMAYVQFIYIDKKSNLINSGCNFFCANAGIYFVPVTRGLMKIDLLLAIQIIHLHTLISWVTKALTEVCILFSDQNSLNTARLFPRNVEYQML